MNGREGQRRVGYGGLRSNVFCMWFRTAFTQTMGPAVGPPGARVSIRVGVSVHPATAHRGCSLRNGVWHGDCRPPGSISRGGIRSVAEAIGEAREQLFGIPNAQVGLGDVCRMPCEQGSCDVCVSFETIEHLEDDRAFLGEVTRVLRRRDIRLLDPKPQPVESWQDDRGAALESVSHQGILVR